MPKATPAPVCPCGQLGPRGQALALAQCCGLYLDSSGVWAPDAASLMRSRYSAFVLERANYLLDTWHPSTRPASVSFETGTQWLGLDVRQHRLRDADHAEVEFVARQRLAGRGHRLHELSRFVREQGRWFYVDGDLH